MGVNFVKIPRVPRHCSFPSYIIFCRCEVLLASMTRNNTLANLLPDLATLLRIYLTLPSASCEAEISFSVLRRLKNYMRTAMSQNRLNHLCILSVYKNIVDALDQSLLVDEFVMRNDQRQARFALKQTLKLRKLLCSPSAKLRLWGSSV